MSKYTTELRFICEHLAGLEESKGYSDINEILSTARPLIFSFSYPIFDDSYKSVLETKILKHFYTREIGEETYSLWKLRLETRMNEIMPFYNKLYESELIEFNPIHDTNYTENYTKNASGNNTRNETNNGTSNEETVLDRDTSESVNTTRTLDRDTTSADTMSGNRWDYFNDTPQGGVTGLENLDYLTNARHITDSSTTNNTGTQDDTETTRRTGTGTQDDTITSEKETTNTQNATGTYTDTETYLHSIVGKRSGISFSKMIEEYRDILLNIDMMIINDLNDLFFNLW